MSIVPPRPYKIVSIEVKIPRQENPWLKMAGQFKDDLHFDEMLADIEAYRRELDEEAESHTLGLDSPEQLK